MLVCAIIATLVFPINWFYFKAMYFNKYGHYNPVKDNLSDNSGEFRALEDDKSSSINHDF